MLSRWSELAGLSLILLIVPRSLTAFERIGSEELWINTRRWLDPRWEAKLRIVVRSHLHRSTERGLLRNVLLQSLRIPSRLQQAGYITAWVLFQTQVSHSRGPDTTVVTLRLGPMLIVLLPQVSSLHEIIEGLVIFIFRADKLNLDRRNFSRFR